MKDLSLLNQKIQIPLTASTKYPFRNLYPIFWRSNHIFLYQNKVVGIYNNHYI